MLTVEEQNVINNNWEGEKENWEEAREYFNSKNFLILRLKKSN